MKLYILSINLIKIYTKKKINELKMHYMRVTLRWENHVKLHLCNKRLGKLSVRKWILRTEEFRRTRNDQNRKSYHKLYRTSCISHIRIVVLVNMQNKWNSGALKVYKRSGYRIIIILGKDKRNKFVYSRYRYQSVNRLSV